MASCQALCLAKPRSRTPAASGPCEMTIELGLPKRLRCKTVVHEYGHWLGLEHSKNRLSPMYPVIDKGAIVPECGRP